MKLLAIDTSTKTLCIGVRNGEKEFEYTVDYGTRLSRWLVPVIQRVLAASGISPRELDHFACGLGPGSFTGIRIGMACVKGLAWSVSAPVCGIVSLDITALNARKEEGLIASVSDARRGFVYAALYRMRNERLTRLSQYLLVSPQGLASEIEKKRGKNKTPVVFCGDGIPVIREQVKNCGDARFLDSDYWKPRGHSLLELARQRIADGGSTNAVEIRPLYLYPKECQIRKKQ